MGPSGAGKTTLVELVLAIRAPTRGRILADGVPYDEIDLARLRTVIGIVLQDPLLLSGTVRENIVHGDPGAAEGDFHAAVEAAGVDGFVDELEQGYDTPVGDGGQRLSAGQRQRIAIARALIRRPRLLVLDEPTSFLDARSVRAVLDGLAAVTPRPTTLVVTHDAAVAATADRSYWLQAGRLERRDAPVG
jgi:ABC-type multidrug transport system fused ATPase/permease subunit